MLELMKQYNALLIRWKDAETFFANEKIPLEKKVEHNDELILLHSSILNTAEQITRNGYTMSEDETENGFRQIKFLEENGGYGNEY